MSIEAIGLFTVALGLAALVQGPDFAFTVFVPMTLLGSAGAVLLGGSGTIQPAHLMLGFLALCVFARPESFAVPLRSLKFPRQGFWLALIVAYGVVGAYFLPRLFAGVTGINAIGSTEYGPSLLLVPLGPTSGNITQSIYLVADMMCFMTTLSFATTPQGFQTITKAILAYCILNIAFAGLDMVTAATNTGYLLGFIRNADYQFHLDEAVVGMKRIVGSFTEASSFSNATIGSLGFTARLCLGGHWPRLTAVLSLISLALLAFSTSSTAYASTPVLLALLYGGALMRLARNASTAANAMFLTFAPLAALLTVLGIALNPTLSEAMRQFFTVVLFEKASSQSGLERTQWNLTALQNFFDTYGFGGGLGSIRTSSFPLAVLSNMGVVGGVAFGAFLATTLLPWGEPRGETRLSDVRAAARMACAGLLATAVVSGALVDLGLPFYVFAALSCAAPERRAMPAPRSGAVSLQR